MDWRCKDTNDIPKSFISKPNTLTLVTFIVVTNAHGPLT